MRTKLFFGSFLMVGGFSPKAPRRSATTDKFFNDECLFTYAHYTGFSEMRTTYLYFLNMYMRNFFNS